MGTSGHRPLRILLLAIGLGLLLLFVWVSRRVLLLAFSGLLIALIFTSLINLGRRFFPVKQGWGVGVLVLVFLGLGALIGWWIVPGLADQFSQLAERVPEIAHDLTTQAEDSEWFQRLNSILPDLPKLMSSSGQAFSSVSSFFTSTFDLLAGLALLIFVALFLAGNPGLYRALALNLIPPSQRSTGAEVLEKVICTLKYWLLGQVISMGIVGFMIGIAFALCGLPLATSLGVLAGLAEFVPFVGPVVAAVPALLLALSMSGKLFFIVLGVYLMLQFVEGHFLMPMVQRRTVDLPPVLTLVAVFFLGQTFGLLGLFVAAPLSAVVFVLIEELYLKRYLGEGRGLMDPPPEVAASEL